MAQYQDIIKNGEVTKKGQRECESRYTSIKKTLEKFNRPFTVLDIGANLGYFSFRIAYDFPQAVCVMIEDHYSDKLLSLCKENNLKNIIFLKKKINADELKKLAECEHFDVVLALNVVHHIGDVVSTMDSIQNLGDNIIIETPYFLDEGACGKENLEGIYKKVTAEYRSIGTFSRHTSEHNSVMGILEQTKSKLKMKYWDASKEFDQAASIDSSADSKYFIHTDKLEKRNWIPGINLRTYQFLNGIFPERIQLVKLLETLDYTAHVDFTPWNLIIYGNGIEMIDIIDHRHILITDSKIQIEKIKEELLTNNIKKKNEYKQQTI
jgi:SAM-dependent methyltransferase